MRIENDSLSSRLDVDLNVDFPLKRESTSQLEVMKV